MRKVTATYGLKAWQIFHCVETAPVIVAGGLLPEDNAVLLSEGGAELAAAGVKALLLQDLGQARVSLELAQAPARRGGNLRTKMA
jgi:hypothetical protein